MENLEDTEFPIGVKRNVEEMDSRSRLYCPPDMEYHCARVLNGEYALPFDFPSPVTILDIGANVGAYTVWADHFYPNIKKIHCYEPASINLPYLRENMAGLAVDAEVHPLAVTMKPGPVKLYYGIHNCGECSIYRIGEQTEQYELVETIHPQNLPPAEIVKIDAERCEKEIILNMNLDPVRLIAFEWHNDDDSSVIDHHLSANGFRKVSLKSTYRDRGIGKYSKLV